MIGIKVVKVFNFGSTLVVYLDVKSLNDQEYAYISADETKQPYDSRLYVNISKRFADNKRNPISHFLELVTIGLNVYRFKMCDDSSRWSSRSTLHVSIWNTWWHHIEIKCPKPQRVRDTQDNTDSTPTLNRDSYSMPNYREYTQEVLRMKEEYRTKNESNLEAKIAENKAVLAAKSAENIAALKAIFAKKIERVVNDTQKKKRSIEMISN